METDNIAHLKALKKVKQERSKALELQIATLGISCPPEIRTEYEKIKQEIHALDQAIAQSRAPRRSPATRKRSAPPVPDTDASAYKRVHERIDCPYPGMAPFRPEDTRFFYGRESEIQQMLKHLRQRRCLYVIGPSGSGKSSLIQAGLLPRLHQSQLFQPGFWLARGMRPGAQPIQRLGETIGRDLADPAQAVAGLLAAHPPAQHLLLILDQFEELFTQAGREEQSRFIAIMRALQEVKECALLIAMRADFYPDLMTCDLWPIAPSQRLDIGPLRGARLRQAIERPAADVGVRLEPELLERLMADAADEPGVLPLVQETMTVLWSEMLDQQLTLSAYERMSGEGRSGLAAALAMKADATFDDLSKPRQAIASRIFLRLVQFGEGRADTRRQQPVTALHAANDQPELFETTLRYLTENRLLTLSGEEHEEPRTKNQEPIDASRFSVLGSRFSVVDIAHESLITGWKTFQRWLTERREAEQTRRRLDAKAIRWAEFGQAGGWLLDPFELREAERWLQSPDAADLGFDPALSALVQASRAAVAEAEREHAARLEAEVVKRHMAFLAEASSTLAASLDYQTTLAQIARLAVPHLADWCTVDVLEEHGLIRPVALVHIDPEREALLHEIHRQHAIDSHSGHPVALVLRGGQPELARDVSDARLLAITESGELAHKLRQVGFASYMVLPLRVGARVLGAITFVSAAPEHQYGPDDLALAEELIRRAATAIENAQLFQERGRQIEQLATFNEIGRALSAVTRQDDLIALIYRQTSRLLNTANFSIALYDERSEIITFPLCYSQGRPTQRPPISAQDGLLARVIRTRAPLLLQGQPPSSERGATVRSWLGVPMIAADAVIGVIAIEDGERDDAYSQDDQRLLSTIASWAATALENAHLLDETRQSVQELTALHDISMALANTLETAAVQRIMASKVLELLQADVCAVCLLDHQRRFVQQFAVDARGMDGSSSAIMRIVERLAGRLLASKRPLVLPDVRAIIDDATTPAPIDLHSALGILIGSPEQPVGVIWLGARQPRAWHEREISLLAILTNQCEQALERARLFQSEQARRRAADTLREVAQTLTSLLAPGDITTMILDQLRRVVPYTSAALMLRDGNLLRITATRGFADPIRSRIEQMRFNLDNDPNLALIVRTRQPLVVEDAQAAEAFISINGSEHIHGWIGAPLLLDDEVIGLLRVDSSTVGAYTHEDGQLAFALASLAAQAIRNSRLFDEVNRFAVQLEQRVVDRTAELADTNAQLSTEKERLQAVHAITLELAQSLDMEATLTKALALVSRAVGTRHGSILLRDLATERLICRALLTGDNAVQATSAPITFARGPGLAGWVMRNRAAACLPDVRKDPRWLQEDGRANGVRSVAAVPLMTKDETLGVLLLSSPRINYFSSAQLQLISTIANEIAIAIHNAELYSFITDQSLRVSELLEYQRRETGKSQAILQSVTEGVIMIDEQQQVVLFNPAAEELLHIPAPFMLQKSLTHLREYNETAEAAARAELIYAGLEAGLRTLGEGEISSHSQILELPAPAQFIVLSFADVLQPFGSPYGCVIVLSDITNEIEANRAKSDFVSSIVRELRDPLTSIKGYADLFLLGKAGHLSDEQRAFVQIIKNNANRLTELNNAIAMVGSIDSGKIREGSSIDPLNLAAIIAQQCQAMRAEIEHRSLTLQAEPARDLPAISADQGHISQIIQALLSNAIKFSYPGGTITIRARRIESSIQVDIGDNGVGIAPAQQQALFRRFYRADNPLRGEVGGVGLGLAITKALVELYGGTIWVSSEVDKGSTFSFSLPITPPGMDGEE